MRGDEITTTHGPRAQPGRPLDFLVLTDHAEMYGLMPMLKKGDQPILAQEKGRKWSTRLFVRLIFFGFPVALL